MIEGKTIGVDATTLEANAAVRNIVPRDTGESYTDFLTGLAQVLWNQDTELPLAVRCDEMGSTSKPRSRGRATFGPRSSTSPTWWLTRARLLSSARLRSTRRH